MREREREREKEEEERIKRGGESLRNIFLLLKGASIVLPSVDDPTHTHTHTHAKLHLQICQVYV